MRQPRSQYLSIVLFAVALVAIGPFVDAYSIRPSATTSTRQYSPLFSQLSLTKHSISALPADTQREHEHEHEQLPTTVRSKLRRLTGFSLTALRATLRGATGISLTALCTACAAATSGLVRTTMAVLLSPFPTWARYFVQPLLIIYYVPLFMIRTMTDQKAMKEKQSTHDVLIQDWKVAIETARTKAGQSWPVMVNEDGEIEMSPSATSSMDDLTTAVVESIELSMVKDQQ